MGMASNEFQTVISDAFTLYAEFAHGGVDMDWGFNPDGSYDEYISNYDAKRVFEELYQLAKDFRTFAESRVARNQRRLEKLTLNAPAAKRLDTDSWITSTSTPAKTSRREPCNSLPTSSKCSVTAHTSEECSRPSRKCTTSLRTREKSQTSMPKDGLNGGMSTTSKTHSRVWMLTCSSEIFNINNQT